MARPCKSVAAQSKHLTAAEKKARTDAEEKLKGASNKITPPTNLNPNQKKIFKNIVNELKASNILCNLDTYILTSCSIAIDRLQSIENMINEDDSLLCNSALMASKEKYTKDLFRCCNELSLSPQSRAKMANINIQAQQDSEDPLLQALNKNK